MTIALAMASDVPANSTPKSCAIHIDELKDGERQYVLRPENNDLFVRTGRQVIEACRLNISVDLWMTELTAMLNNVREWAGAHPAHVHSVYCAPKGARVVLFFMPPGEQFDFDLAEQLADLNRDLLTRFNVGAVEVHQIPWGERHRFLDLDTSWPVYGEHDERGPHHPVEA